MYYRVSAIILTVLTVFLLSRPAAAYIDPGTGSMMLQLLIGGIAGSLLILKIYYRRIVDKLHSWFGKEVEEAEEDGN